MKIYFYILKEFCKFLARLIGKVQYLDITSILSIKNGKFPGRTKKGNHHYTDFFLWKSVWKSGDSKITSDNH